MKLYFLSRLKNLIEIYAYIILSYYYYVIDIVKVLYYRFISVVPQRNVGGSIKFPDIYIGYIRGEPRLEDDILYNFCNVHKYNLTFDNLRQVCKLYQYSEDCITFYAYVKKNDKKRLRYEIKLDIGEERCYVNSEQIITLGKSIDINQILMNYDSMEEMQDF